MGIYLMANAFDQFDENPFNQFDESDIKTYSGLSAKFPEVAAKIEGFYKGAKDPLDAMAQMLYEAAPKKVREDVNAFNNWVSEKTGILEEIPEEGLSAQLQQQEQAYQAGREPGFDWPRLAGGVAGAAIPGMGAARMVAPATKLGTLGAAAGTGALYGTTIPVTEEGDFWAQKSKQAGIGAAMGPAIPAIGMAGRGIGKYAKGLAEPFFEKGRKAAATRFLQEQAGPGREEIIQVLARGGKGTAGQTLAREAGPEEIGRQFIKMEKELSKEPLTGGRLKGIYNRQQAAREKIINKIAGTDEDMTKALTTRKEITAPMYKMVEESSKNVDIKPVVGKIDEILQKSKFERGVTSPLSRIKQDLAEDVSPKALQSLSKEIRAMMGKTTPGGQKEYNVKALNEVKELLDKQIGEAERMYSAAQGAYQKLSSPVNRMEVGKELAKALTSSMEKERPGVFVEAVAQAARTIKRATGFPRYEKLAQVLSKQETKDVGKVAKGLVEKGKFEQIASQTKSVLDELPKEFSLSLPHILSRPIVITNAALKLLGKDIEPDMKRIISEIMENPKSLEAALRLPPKDIKAKAALMLLKEAGIAATAQPAAREVQ